MAKKNLSGSWSKDGKKRLGGGNAEQRKKLRKELGELINKYRIIRGFSQLEISLMCGYDYNILLKWENGNKPYLTPEDANKLIDVLKLPETVFDEFKSVIEERKYTVGKYRELGTRVKDLLVERGVSQQDLAHALDIYPQHVSGFVNGTVEPKIHFIRKIVDLFFDVDKRGEALNFLFYGVKPPKLSYAKQLHMATEKIKYLESEIEELKKMKEGAV